MFAKIIFARSLIITVIAIVYCQALPAQQRYALVIGNSDYQKMGKLKNPVNDASDMGKLLKQKGFNVMVLKNAKQREMETAIRRLTIKLQQKESVGLFYFAGHGAAVDGRNYLIPIDADINNTVDVKYKSVDAGYVLDQMQYSDNNLNMLILDACRDNPFKNAVRGVARGLAPIHAARGALILYAASVGEVASDGKGRNGLFTSHLMQAIKTPGLKVEDVFKQTVIDVTEATHDAQWPWSSGSIKGNFYFTINPPIATGHPPAKQTKARLTVRTSPEKAKVRILNIAPKYQDGMELKPGRYHIEVTHADYQRSTQWIELAAGEQVHSVSLQQGKISPPAISNMRTQEFVKIQGGCYQMGSPSEETGRDDDEKQSRVCVDDFQLGKYEVTVGEFQKFIDVTSYITEAERNIEKEGCWAYERGENKWQWRIGRSWRNPGFKQNDKHPVVCVSWNDVNAYIDWFNEAMGTAYRLPTEAEWEYAARGGSTKAYFWGNSIDTRACRYANLNDKNWSNKFPCDDDYEYTAPVGYYRGNDFGLYDMLGNVWEWTCSKYDKNYQSEKKRCLSKNDANKDVNVVNRGGSFEAEPRWLRSANRGEDMLWGRTDAVGFRLAM